MSQIHLDAAVPSHVGQVVVTARTRRGLPFGATLILSLPADVAEFKKVLLDYIDWAREHADVPEPEEMSAWQGVPADETPTEPQLPIVAPDATQETEA